MHEDLTSRAIRLQSEHLDVDVLPGNGGRIASIQCRRTGTEFLLDGSNYAARAAFPSDAPFEDSDCAGWDECLPTVSLSTSTSGAEDAPDHGDLWRHAWSTLESSPHHIVLSTRCVTRPFTFTRSLRLDGATLLLDYTVRNDSDRPAPFLYACHPLFAVDPGDEVLLPREVTTVELHYSADNRLGAPVQRLHWPTTASTAIHRVGHITDRTAEMFYAPSVPRGACALYRKTKQQAILMRFTTDTLPHLGLWICNGGWPERQTARRQYAVALEPTVAPFGSLAAAVAANAAPVLSPQTDVHFSIAVEVLGCEQPCSADEVEARVNQPFTFAGQHLNALPESHPPTAPHHPHR